MFLHSRKCKVLLPFPKSNSTGKQHNRFKVFTQTQGNTSWQDHNGRHQKSSCSWNHKGNGHPCHHVKRMDMVRTGKPSTKAVSSSKVRIYIGRKKRKVKIKTTAAMTKREITCSSLIVTIEPKGTGPNSLNSSFYPCS